MNIQVLESTAHHLQTVYGGSLLHNQLTFTTLSYIQSVLQARKLAKLEEMEGQINRDEEEEPEGKVVVGPSGEAIVYSSGNIPLFFSLFFTSFHQYTVLHFTVLSSFMIGWIGILNHASPSHPGSSCSEMSLMKRRK